MELDAARLAFESLGAATDVAQVERLLGTSPGSVPAG